jgi:hypothetical protein
MNKIINSRTLIVILLVVVAVLLFFLYNNTNNVGIKGAIGLNFDADGEFQFVDSDGNPIEPIPFKEHLVNHVNKYEESGQDWTIEKGSTLTIFQVKGSHQIWFVWDNESICLEFDDNGKLKRRCN